MWCVYTRLAVHERNASKYLSKESYPIIAQDVFAFPCTTSVALGERFTSGRNEADFTDRAAKQSVSTPAIALR